MWSSRRIGIFLFHKPQDDVDAEFARLTDGSVRGVALIHEDAEHGGLIIDPREPVQSHELGLTVLLGPEQPLDPEQEKRLLLIRTVPIWYLLSCRLKESMQEPNEAVLYGRTFSAGSSTRKPISKSRKFVGVFRRTVVLR